MSVSLDSILEDRILDIKKVLAKVSIMCPALMLAARRNDKVIGRRRTLTVSIRTKMGLNHLGAPAGSRWAKKDLGS